MNTLFFFIFLQLQIQELKKKKKKKKLYLQMFNVHWSKPWFSLWLICYKTKTSLPPSHDYIVRERGEEKEFYLVSLFKGVSTFCRLFNAKAIFVEGQSWYYLTHTQGGDKELHTFPKNIILKVNAITWLEIEIRGGEMVRYLQHGATMATCLSLFAPHITV